MGKVDKRMQDRISGMIYARDIAKTKGIEELEKDIKMRGMTYLQLEIKKETVDKIITSIATRMFNSYIVAVYKVLNEHFGFGKDRLHRFKKEFDEVCKDISTVDCYGDLLYTFGDYANIYNEKYDLNIDLDKVDEVDCMNRRSYGTVGVDVHSIEILLHENGFDDASKFLRSYMGGDE